ncbi:hypothetical protein HY041_02910 [Candidatus Roizmanbacteria bacterium]|nr:hypothetical protein [Candidatus Roizmanbacteria bacterium]
MDLVNSEVVVGQSTATNALPQPDLNRLNTHNLLASLNPENVRDENGVKRNIYTFRNRSGRAVKVMFYSPEELPFCAQAMKNKQGFIYGDKPHWRTEEEWKSFVEKVRAASKNGSYPLEPNSIILSDTLEKNEAFIYVESTPKAVLDLAFILGVEDKNLREIRRDFARGSISNEAQEFMDRIIAGDIIDDNGELNLNSSHAGEAISVLAFLRNQDAIQLLRQKQNELKEIDEERVRRLEDEAKATAIEGEEALKMEDLVGIHLTRYRPKMINGHMEIQSTFDATKGRLPWNTVHFYLNSSVVSHETGNWEDAKYGVITPLNKLIESNHRPLVVNTGDTFFEVSPGKTLKLPEDAVLVRPSANLADGEIYKIRSTEVIYKTENFTSNDLTVLGSRLSEQDKGFLNQDISMLIVQQLISNANPVINETELQVLRKRLGLSFPQKVVDYIELSKDEPLQIVINRYFRESGLEGKILPTIRREIERGIEGKIASVIQEQAMRAKIREMGFKDRAGGKWGWVGETSAEQDGILRQTAALGAQLGIPFDTHANHIAGELKSSLKAYLVDYIT